MTVYCDQNGLNEDSSSKDSNNRRTLSESDVRRQESVKNETFNPPNPKQNLEDFQQKRSHSLPHRYKIPHPNLTMMSGTRGNVTTPTRQKCVSPQEFRRGIQAMQSWFHNLNDNQRTLALQSIAVS